MLKLRSIGQNDYSVLEVVVIIRHAVRPAPGALQRMGIACRGSSRSPRCVRPPNDHLPRLGRFVGVGDCDELAERHAADSTAWCLFGLEHDIGQRDAVDVLGERAGLVLDH